MQTSAVRRFRNSESSEQDLTNGFLAAAGALGAVLASSCCIVPLLFVVLGVGGAWMGHLTALEPYKTYFAATALMFLGFGFWRIYIKPKSKCESETACANPVSSRLTKIVLWSAGVLVLLSMTIDYWAPFFY